MTNLLMAILLICMALLLLLQSKVMPKAEHFFDKQNSAAMRGFCSLVVILVHIPAAYQNRIQDMIGSFAYICVTFFFMTSGYGLTISLRKDPSGIETFWRKRLPKLLIPILLVNVTSLLLRLAEGRHSVSVFDLIYITGWVRWLLVCYFVFWFAHRVISVANKYRDLMICIGILLFSVVVYLCRDSISETTWCPEVFGFAWGIILASVKQRFSDSMRSKWITKCVILCVVSGILGIAYLKFKPLVFFGDYLLKVCLGLAIILLVLAINTKISIGNKASLFLGAISYEIFLLHGAAFGVVKRFVPSVNSGLFILLSILLTILLAWIIHRLSSAILKRVNPLLVHPKNNRSIGCADR